MQSILHQATFSSGNSRLITSLLGTEAEPKTTLLLLANNNSIRVGGGFVGTVGILYGDGRSIKIKEVRSVYYYDHRLEKKGAFAVAPDYMSNFTSSLRIGDSLQSPSSRQNLQLARDIYMRESGKKVDNVVEITPNMIKDILAITGPIELSEYKKTISDKNFLETLQLEVESGADRVVPDKDPKTVIGVLGEAIIARIPSLSLHDTRRLVDLVERASQGDGLRALISLQASPDSTEVITNSQEQVLGAQNAVLIATANLDSGKPSSLITQTNNLTYTFHADDTEQLDITVERTHTATEKLSYIDPRTGGGNDIIGTDVSEVLIYTAKSMNLTGDGQFTRAAFESSGVVFQAPMVLQLQDSKTVEASLRQKVPTPSAERISGQKVVLLQFGAFSQRLKATLRAPEGYQIGVLPQNARRIDERTIAYDLPQKTDLTLAYDFVRAR